MCSSKISTDLCFTKKNKNKKWFCRSCLQCFSSENVLIKHKENYLSINGKQSVKLEKGIIEFENYFKQMTAPFKIYADFQILTHKKISRSHSFSFAYKVCIDDRFTKQIDNINNIELKKQLMNLLKQFLRSINIAKK